MAYALGAAFTHVDKGWRILVALGCVPAIVQLGASWHPWLLGLHADLNIYMFYSSDPLYS